LEYLSFPRLFLFVTIVVVFIAVLLPIESFVYANAKFNNSDPFAQQPTFSSKQKADKIPVDINEDGDGAVLNTESKNLILGTNGNDFIVGTPNDDIIYGLKGDDQIYGLGGDDTTIGGKGDDTMDGGAGNDTIYGNKGNDFLVGNTGLDTLIAGQGDDTLRGRNSFISEAEPDSFDCGPGADVLDDFNPSEGDTKTIDCE
jgi:Ca2+-binding RTX toxin-like protein